jgi:hypothetical protein
LQTLALIDLEDLRWFELTCECGASVTFDMGKEESLFPDQCPSCKKTWNGFASGVVVAAFKNFKNFYDVFSKTKFQPRFRANVRSSGTTTE